MIVLLSLVVGHALCDYPLQGDFLARGKNHRSPLPGVPWWQCLLAHSVIHAGMVALLTGSVVLGLGELLAHFVTDYAKNEGIVGYNEDQAIHVGCKVAWVLIPPLVASSGWMAAALLCATYVAVKFWVRGTAARGAGEA